VRIAFVHAPMPAVAVPARKQFWRSFDGRYHGAHPGLLPMEEPMWELPHWMHWLGGVLESRGYADLEVIDLYFAGGTNGSADDLTWEQSVDAAVSQSAAECFLFSPMTANLHVAMEIAGRVKRLNPTAVVIFGGVVATPLAADITRAADVDYVVAGRGEHALPDLLDAVGGKRTLGSVSGLVFEDPDDRSVHLSPPARHMSASELPFPKVDLFPASAGRNLRYLRQVHALGCPFTCSFCTIQTIGRRPEYFPVHRVLAEIEAYRDRYGRHHNIYFGDETFTLHPEMTLTLLDALRDAGDISFDCQTRLNCLTDQRVLEALSRSGCRWIEIGLETGHQATLNIHKRGTELGNTEMQLSRIRDLGMAACAFVVNGFPGQTLDDMRQSIEWAADLVDRGLLHASYLFGLVPYPGSALFADPERNNLVLEHRDFRRYHEDLAPVYHTDLASSDDIYDVFLDGVEILSASMSRTPWLGGRPSVPADQLGNFWAGPHG
jgi:anaerobic magnesium-protoporphyrin IX monomethyl ester cyclase